MMERMHDWIFRSVEGLIICLLILIRSTGAQEGFLSIACCATSNFTDSTFTSWIPDNAWFPEYTSCYNITKGTALNNTDYDKSRIFYISSGKRCYNLPTTKDQDYLIRGRFLVGDPVRSLGSSIDVWIGVTPISQVNSTEYSEVEGIVRASDQSINFCLVHQTGDPFISQLELRPLDDLKYLQENAYNVLKLVHRIDLGNIGASIRYPDDIYDRIWKSPEPETVSASTPIYNTSIGNADTRVPLKVLQTAVTNTDKLVILHDDLDGQAFNYTVFLYFLELNSSVVPGQRVFDIYINSELKLERFDILVNGSGHVALTATANGSLNVTLVKVPNGFQLGPILNAYEILQVRAWVPGTNQQDVNAIVKVRSELLLENKNNVVLPNWSGDPCLPEPWKGLTCNNMNGSYVITGVDISESSFQGPIPAGITQLPYLQQLNISNNHLTGEIPPFWAFTMLTSVDLSHNDLTGSLPDSLTSLPHLTTLYCGCNPQLTKDLPSSSNQSRLSTDSDACAGQGSRKTQGIVIGTIAGGSVLFTIAVGVGFAFIYRRKFLVPGKFHPKQHPMTKNAVFSIPSTEDVSFRSINIQMFTLSYIENATQKYKTLIGEGGFGSVYRGTLPDSQEVAVKVRSSTSTQGTREFENELNLLSAIQHENLVPLLGYCSENDQQILVYPFMSNGSLQDRLYGEASKRKTLDWPTRLSIALGAARGLTYLHTFAGRCVIHRDVKSSNILLDHSMNAKVADFGFSKYAPQEGDSGASLEVRGTAGYLDPEYYTTQHLSAKSDVFSFGVVLLEIVSGREPLNINRPRNEWSLIEWAKPFIRESKIDEIVDPNIKEGYHAEAMWRVVEVALACIEPFSAYRPCMADIVRELEDALIIENNASEYMKSIDSMYSVGGSNRFSIVTEKKIPLPPPAPTPTEPSPASTQTMAPPEPR